MLVRRKSRILAVMMLYALEQQNDSSSAVARRVTSLFSPRLPQAAEDYAMYLINIILTRHETYDEHIARHIHNWKYDRIPSVDRQIMRVALCEMERGKNTPYPVIINEAIDIAKIFGTPESPAFINGILDAVAKDFQSHDTTDGATE